MMLKNGNATTNLSVTTTPGFAAPTIVKRAMPPKQRAETATAQSPFTTAFDQIMAADRADWPELCIEVKSQGKNVKAIEAARNAATKFNTAHKAEGIKVSSRFLGLDDEGNQVVGFWVTAEQAQ